MHCRRARVPRGCPAPGASCSTSTAIVDVDPEKCIGCGLCETGAVRRPRYAQGTNKMAKCTLCVDRVSVGLEPACIKACPTGCLQFGDKTALVEAAKTASSSSTPTAFAQAAYYDPQGVGGTGVITVLKHGDHPVVWAAEGPDGADHRQRLEAGAASDRLRRHGGRGVRRHRPLHGLRPQEAEDTSKDTGGEV